MPNITRIMLLVLWALCTPFGGTFAQNTEAPRASAVPTVWDGWVPYNPAGLTEVNPQDIVRTLHAQMLRQFESGRIPRPTSPTLRQAYSSPDALRTALARRYEVFKTNTPVPMERFLGLIDGRGENRVGFYLPIDPPAVVRAAAPLVRQPAPVRGEGVTPPPATNELTILRERLERLERQLQEMRSRDPSGQVSALEQQFEAVTAGLVALQSGTGDHANQQARVASLEERLGQLGVQVAALARVPASLERRVTALEETTVAPSSDGMLYVSMTIGGVAFLLVCLIWYRHGRKLEVSADRYTLLRREVRYVEEQVTNLLSPRFDASLVSSERIAKMSDKGVISVPVTLPSEAMLTVTVKRHEMQLRIGPMRRMAGGPLEILEFPLNANVPSIIANAGRQGRLGEVEALAPAHLKDAA